MHVDYDKESPNAGGHLEWGVHWRMCVCGEMINRLSERQEVNQEKAVPEIQIAESREKSMPWQTLSNCTQIKLNKNSKGPRVCRDEKVLNDWGKLSDFCGVDQKKQTLKGLCDCREGERGHGALVIKLRCKPGFLKVLVTAAVCSFSGIVTEATCLFIKWEMDLKTSDSKVPLRRVGTTSNWWDKLHFGINTLTVDVFVNPWTVVTWEVCVCTCKLGMKTKRVT